MALDSAGIIAWLLFCSFIAYCDIHTPLPCLASNVLRVVDLHPCSCRIKRIKIETACSGVGSMFAPELQLHPGRGVCKRARLLLNEQHVRDARSVPSRLLKSVVTTRQARTMVERVWDIRVDFVRSLLSLLASIDVVLGSLSWGDLIRLLLLPLKSFPLPFIQACIVSCIVPGHQEFLH